MYITRVLLSLLLGFVSFFPLSAQQAQPGSPQPLVLLQQSLNVLTAGLPLTDVSLTGTARRVAGSDDETGTATLKAVAKGASRIDLSLPSGQWSEIKDASTNPATGIWFGPDGISHTIAGHNLLTEPAWFFPTFVVARGLSNPTYTATYVGHETWNSTSVEHVAVYQQLDSAAGIGGIVQHLTQEDIYLDSATFLPIAITLNIHPDTVTTEDIPLIIRFSDYRSVNGAQIPFHVEKYMNNSLILDLHFQSAALNTGLTTRIFKIQ